MNIRKLMLSSTALAAVSVGALSQAVAAGYEKSIMWGGRSAGVAGIATPYMTGSQALYFNPAGLVGNNTGHDVSLNVSPVWSQFQGPINNNNDVVESKTKLSVPFGLIYGGTITENIGFGVGGYISAGNQVTYDNVNMGLATAGEVKTALTVGEIAAGLGWKVNDSLKLGASYRVVMANADFSFIQRNPANTAQVFNVKLTDLEDTQWTGFKVGAQYKLTESTLIGFTYRSEVDLEAKGNIGGTVLNNGSSFQNTDGTVKTTFPMAATLGVQHDLNESWRFLGEYAWTQYSVVDQIVVEGNVTLGNGTVINGGRSEVQQQWKDQHNVRVGGEYLAFAWPIRVGYGFTSQVTNDDWARASFTPPGPAHTVTLGTGHTFTVFENPLQFDVAGEYTFTKGDGNGRAPGELVTGANNNDIRAGEHETNSYALHMGLTYAF